MVINCCPISMELVRSNMDLMRALSSLVDNKQQDFLRALVLRQDCVRETLHEVK